MFFVIYDINALIEHKYVILGFKKKDGKVNAVSLLPKKISFSMLLKLNFVQCYY